MPSEFSLRAVVVLGASLLLPGCQLPEEDTTADPTVLTAEAASGQPLNPALRGQPINEAARALAGLGTVAENRALVGIKDSSAWPYHQAQMNALWRHYELSRGNKTREWAQQEFPDLQRYRAMFYPFSGPDFVYARDMFPSADTYILCGLEPADTLPDFRALSPGETAVALTGLRTALSSIINAGYFVTKDMRSDLQSTRMRGTLPVMLAFLARMGATIDSVDSIQLDASGNPIITQGPSSGLLIRFHGGGGGRKRLFYFSQDLSNSHTKLGGPFLTFVANQGNPPALVKSASYLMHQDSFSNIRTYLTQSTPGLVQDPSGVPYRHLVASGMTVDLYGNYQGTLNIFSQQQPDLVAAYRSGKHKVKPMTFGFGYLYNRATTSIMVARRVR